MIHRVVAQAPTPGATPSGSSAQVPADGEIRKMLVDRIDRDRLVTCGHSAGGHLALWAAGRHRLPPGTPGEHPHVTLRGVVSFQWRHGTSVEYTVSRPTTAGHVSLAGADPKGFSAAECLLS